MIQSLDMIDKDNTILESIDFDTREKAMVIKNIYGQNPHTGVSSLKCSVILLIAER